MTRPVMVYESKCWTIDRNVEQRMSVTKIRQLSEMFRKGKVKNEYIRNNIRIASIINLTKVN